MVQKSFLANLKCMVFGVSVHVYMGRKGYVQLCVRFTFVI
jgi:hypothetical protein